MFLFISVRSRNEEEGTADCTCVRRGAGRRMTQSWLKEKEMYSWGRSSAGRAPALQAGGQEFDSPRLHHMNLENFIEETKQSLRYYDECLSTSDLNANLETSNENTRERKFLSKLNQKIAKRNCSDPRSEEESHRRLYSGMSRMANDERQRSRQFIEAILSQATKGIR